MPLAAHPPEAVFDSVAAAAPALILAERTAAVEGDLATLAQLWATNSRVVDGRNTVDQSDDYIWEGRDAVLDRYVVAVFPNPPPPLGSLPKLSVQQVGNTAVALNDQDHWRLERRDGRWWLTELVYQRPHSD
jgi:hypothetical protein